MKQTTIRRGLVIVGEAPQPRVLTRFDEWRPSPHRGGEPLETERRLPPGAAGASPSLGQYGGNATSLDFPAAVPPPRGPFFAPPERVRRRGVPVLATILGVGLTALVAALCIAVFFSPAWVHLMIWGAVR